MNTNFKVIGLTPLGIKPKAAVTVAYALTSRPPELLMSAMPTSLHLSSLLKPKTKKQTHLCNVMGAIAYAYKPNPAAAQYLLMPVSRWFECCLCRNDVLPSTLNMQTRTDTSRQSAGVWLLPSPIMVDIRL